LLGRDPEPTERDWLAAMHLGTERHATTSLQVSAMLCDYRDLAGRLSGRLPFANAVREDWIGQAEPWLAAQAPKAVLWPIPSHLAFWDTPGDFNHRLAQFLQTGK
jgi:non-heme chloroperoxidase